MPQPSIGSPVAAVTLQSTTQAVSCRGARSMVAVKALPVQLPTAYCIHRTRIDGERDPPPRSPRSVRAGEVPLSYDAVSDEKSRWPAMSLLRLLTGTGNSPRGTGSCGGMLLVMLALSGLLTPRRRRWSTPIGDGQSMCWSFLAYLLAGVAAVASFGYLA